MRRVVFLFLIVVLFSVGIISCKINEPNILYPEIAKRYQLDSLFIYKVENSDTQKTHIFKVNKNGKIIYQLNYISDMPFFEIISYDELQRRTKSIIYDKDSTIVELAIWHYLNDKIFICKQFHKVESIDDTLEPQFQYIFNYKSSKKYDTIIQYEILENTLHETFDTVLSEKRISDKRNKKLMYIDFNASPGLDREGVVDTGFYMYDVYGRLKEIKYYNKIVKYKYRGKYRLKEEQQTNDKQLISKTLYSYNQMGLLKMEIAFSYQKDSIIKEFSCGEHEQIDTTFYDYSVKPTIYLYKYTKRKQ